MFCRYIVTFWHFVHIVTCFSDFGRGFELVNWWVDLLDIHQAELQFFVTLSYCNYNTS
jgi:hypothetical protein